jgi:lipoxygenase homology domain-containing protein 1
MENLKTNKRYLFRCGRWLSKTDDDKQIIRELPAEGPGIKNPLSVVKYNIDIYTGNKSGAGTDANVFINIFGEIGDTGG